MVRCRRRRSRRLLSAIVVLQAFVLTAPSYALDVALSWSPGGAGQRLELSRDEGFSDLIGSAVVGGGAHRWQAPAEGVYHWRVSSSNGARVLAAGSLAVIDAGPDGERLRLSWSASGGGSRFRIEVADQGTRRFSMTTDGHSVVLPRLGVPVTVTVEPQPAARPRAPLFRLRAGLALAAQPGVPARSAGPALAAQPGVPAPSSGPAAAPGSPPALPETEPAPLAPVSEEPTGAPPLQPEGGMQTEEESPESVRPGPASEALVPEPEPAADPRGTALAPSVRTGEPPVLLRFAAGFLRDSVMARKLEVGIDSEVQGMAGAAALALRPWPNLAIGLAAELHRHRQEIVQIGLFAGKPAQLDQTRLAADLHLGYDVAGLIGFADALSLAPTANLGYALIPFLPLEFAGERDEPPVFSEERPLFFGGGLLLGYRAGSFGLSLQGSQMVSRKDAGELAWGRIWLDLDVYGGWLASVGAVYRQTSQRRCHPVPVTCLQEGKVSTASTETGIFLGVGSELR